MHARADHRNAPVMSARTSLHHTSRAAALAVAALARMMNSPVAGALAAMRPAEVQPAGSRGLASDLDAFLPMLAGAFPLTRGAGDGSSEARTRDARTP